MGLAVAAMTAFYMFRLYHMTFSGTFRGTEEQAHHVHESPRTMVLPCRSWPWARSWPGCSGSPPSSATPCTSRTSSRRFTEPVFEAAHETLPQVFTAAPPAHSIEMGLMAASVTIAALGITLAWLLFRRHPELPGRVASSIAPVYRLLLNKYYVDEIYGALFVRGAALGGGTALYAVDRYVVDGGDGEVRPGLGVNGIGWVVREGVAKTSDVCDRWFVDGAGQPRRRHLRQHELRVPLAAERPRPALRAVDADHHPVHDRDRQPVHPVTSYGSNTGS